MADPQSELREIRAGLRSLADRLDRLERSILNAPASAPSERAAAAPAPAGATGRGQTPGEMWEEAMRRSREAGGLAAGAPPIARAPALPRVPTLTSRGTSEMESKIGAHWLNRIGIAALLVGVAYFLKLAFQNGWIGPAGRIAIGLVAGIAVVAWSERFRSRGYQYFSIGLKAVGIGTLYLSLWAAFQLYHLIPGSVASIAMMVVTASGIAMALTQNEEILAALALVGGFVTPLLLSTGENRELQLFSYVALLDLASVVLAVQRPWRRLLVLSFVGTLFFYTGWYSEFYDVTQLPLTAIFATVFFGIFALAPLAVKPLGEGHVDLPQFPVLLTLGSAVLYFAQIYVMLEEPYPHGAAWVALALAAFYVALTRVSEARATDPSARSQLRLVHLALAIGFVTIAIPIRLDGQWITIGWAVEAAALLWVGTRMQSDLITGLGGAALLLSIGRLVAIDDMRMETHFLNARLGANVIVIAILGAFAQVGAKRGDEKSRQAARLAVVVINILALLALSREVNDHFVFERGHGAFDASLAMQEAFTYSGLWMLYGAMLMILGFIRRSADLRWMALIVIALTIAKVFLYDISELDRAYRVVSFIVLGVLLLGISFMYQRGWIQMPHDDAEAQP